MVQCGWITPLKGDIQYLLNIIIQISVFSSGLDEVQYGWITPLNGDISADCKKDSLNYATTLQVQ